MDRGLSGFITVLILVALVLVTSVVVWRVVGNVVQEQSEGIALQKFMVRAEIKDVSIDYSANNISLTVKREAGKGDVTGIKFVFSTGVDTEIITEEFSVKEMEEKIFTFHLIKLNVDDLISVSIVPIINVNGKESLGNVVDVYDFFQ